MTGLQKLPKEVQMQLGLGTVLTIVGAIWVFVILYLLKPDQILPTNEAVREAYDGVSNITSIPYNLWTLRTAGEFIANLVFLVVLDILFVVARYGGLTLLFLGGFAIFEAISNIRKARR